MNNNCIDRDRVKQIYEERFSKKTVLNETDEQLSYIMKYLPNDKSCRILDAGCGDGRYSIYLSELGYKNITAVDLLDKSPKDNLSYQKASVDELPFENDSFDFVFSNSVIFYVDPPSKALAEFHRVMKPGGLVIFTAHTKWSLFTLQRWLKRDLLRLPQMSHLLGVKFYSSKYYNTALEQLGFRVELRDGWRFSFFFQPLYRMVSLISKKHFAIKLAKIKPWIPKSRLLRYIKSEISYHSIFVALKE
jgi:SAM-dependent methyltransferase